MTTFRSSENLQPSRKQVEMTTSKSKHASARTPRAGMGSSPRIAVLGAGKMGGILLQAFLKRGLFRPEAACATLFHAEKAAAREKTLGVTVFTDNLKAVRQADIVLVCVKPQIVRSVMEQIRPALHKGKLVFRSPRPCRRRISKKCCPRAFPWCARCLTRHASWGTA